MVAKKIIKLPLRYLSAHVLYYPGVPLYSAPSGPIVLWDGSFERCWHEAANGACAVFGNARGLRLVGSTFDVQGDHQLDLTDRVQE